MRHIKQLSYIPADDCRDRRDVIDLEVPVLGDERSAAWPFDGCDLRVRLRAHGFGLEGVCEETTAQWRPRDGPDTEVLHHPQ